MYTRCQNKYQCLFSFVTIFFSLSIVASMTAHAQTVPESTITTEIHTPVAIGQDIHVDGYAISADHAIASVEYQLNGTNGSWLPCTITTVRGPQGTRDLGFTSGLGEYNGLSGLVRSVQALPSGKTLIAGDFTHISEHYVGRIARLNADGSIDTTFDAGTGANSLIRRILVLADQTILVVGNFTTFDGTTHNRIVKLTSDGSVDPSFDPGTAADNQIRAVAVQADDKIMIGGTFTTYDGISRNRIARINPDGSLDSTFDPGSGMDGNVVTFAIQSDGKILIGGLFSVYDGNTANSLVRANTDGSIDLTFSSGGGPDGDIRTIAIQSTNKIVIGGAFYEYDFNFSPGILRVNIDGSYDSSFVIGGNGAEPPRVEAIQVLDNDHIVVGGDFNNFSTYPDAPSLIQLLPDGSQDNSFQTLATLGKAAIYAIAEDSSGRFLLGGNISNFDATDVNNIIRIEANGDLDNSFLSLRHDAQAITSVIIADDGSIIAAGSFTKHQNNTVNRVMRLNSDGSYQGPFYGSSGPNQLVSALAKQSNGKVIVTGSFTSFDGNSSNYIARLNSDGTLDNSFAIGTGANGAINAVVVDPDDKIIIAGTFTSFNSNPSNRIARLNSDGSFDSSFSIGSGFNNEASKLAIDSQGRIVVAGSFATFNGTARTRIARLLSTGVLDVSFTPTSGVNNTIYSMTLTSDDKVVIGGDFTTVNGIARNRVARISSDGTTDTSFIVGTGANQRVTAVHVTPDDRILLAGSFTTYNSVANNGFARLLTTGSVDPAFIIAARPLTARLTGQINTMVIDSNGDVIIGGNFVALNNQGANNIVKFFNYNRANFSCMIDTSGLAPGMHTAYFRVTDVAANTTSSDFPTLPFEIAEILPETGLSIYTLITASVGLIVIGFLGITYSRQHYIIDEFSSD